MAQLKLKKIGIVAGDGRLPGLLVNSFKEKGYSYKVIGIRGFYQESVSGISADFVIGLGQIGKAFKYFKEANIKEIILVGGIKKPKIYNLFPDFKTIEILLKLGLLRLGDNRLITSLIKVIEEEGFIVEGVKSYLPELIAPLGTIGSIKVSKENKKNIHSAFLAARTFGLQDIGQAIVWKDGSLIAKEDDNGTDFMLTKILSEDINKSRRGLLVKVMKPGQEIRVDMPTIGPNTVVMAKSAGLDGIVIHAGYTIIVEIQKTIKLANKSGLFLLGYKCE